MTSNQVVKITTTNNEQQKIMKNDNYRQTTNQQEYSKIKTFNFVKISSHSFDKPIFDYETTKSKINIEDPLPTLKDTKVSQ